MSSKGCYWGGGGGGWVFDGVIFGLASLEYAKIAPPVWPKNMRRVLPSDELVGVGNGNSGAVELFPIEMDHEQRMRTIATSSFPLELVFRKLWS